MSRNSLQRVIGVLLVTVLLAPSLQARGQQPIPPDTSTSECERDPAACVAGSALAVLVAPYTYPFTDFRASYRPGERTVLGLRLEHRFRTIGAVHERMHPYVGVGMNIGHRVYGAELAGMGGATTDIQLETVLGYQWALGPVLESVTSWASPFVVGTEVQWLPFQASAPLRTEVTPGISLHLPSGRWLRFHISASVSLLGERRGRVHPGFGIAINWK